MQLLAGKIVEVAFPGRNVSTEVESLEQAVEQVEVLCRDVLVELEESRLSIRDLDSQVSRTNENLTESNKERDQLANSLSASEVQIQKLSLDLNSKASELRTATETNRSLQNRLREVTETEIPKWQREAEKATERVKQLGHFVENYESTLKQSQQENEEITRKYSEIQQICSKIQSELSDVKDFNLRLQEQRDELVERLSIQENTTQSAQKRLEELQGRVGHTEKVKSSIEEQFNRELKNLHTANAELKGQLSMALNARSELSQRVDRLSQLLREAERGQDEIIEKGRHAEGQLSSLRREHEILILEHKTLETELLDRQVVINKLEQEISRTRREDQMNRRTHDGLEHLQAKVESLSAMNSFLKDQTETRERTIRSLEDRLRHQQEEMRRSREEVDAQSRKLKKREILISQALKRLESINHMKQVQAVTAGLELNTPTFRDDHHPLLLSTPTKIKGHGQGQGQGPPSKRSNIDEY
jgi:chromosome segregation ATPase